MLPGTSGTSGPAPSPLQPTHFILKPSHSDSPANASTGQNRGAIGIIFLVLLIDLIGFSIIFPLFPAMLDYYFFSGKESSAWLQPVIQMLMNWSTDASGELSTFRVTVLFGGLLGSLYAVLQFIFAPIWGRLSDKIGRRPVLAITLTGVGVSYLLWIFADTFLLLVIARVLGGIMAGNLSVATAVVSDVTSRENRAKGMAVVGIAFGIGMLLGPAIGGTASKWNWAESFPGMAAFGFNPFSFPAAIAFVLALINLVWFAARYKETLPEEKRHKAPETKGALARITGLFGISHPQIKQVCMAYLLFMLAFSGIEFTIAFLVAERFNFVPHQTGYLFVYIAFWLLIAQGVLVRRLAPKVGEKKLALAGVACGVVAFVAIALAHTLPLMLIAMAFFSFAVGLVSPTLSSLVSLYASNSEQGRYLGTFRSAGSLARAIGPLLAAFGYFSIGSTLTYLIAALFLLPPLLVLARTPQPTHEEPETKAATV